MRLSGGSTALWAFGAALAGLVTALWFWAVCSSRQQPPQIAPEEQAAAADSWLLPPPGGLEFSASVDGLSIALRGPHAVAAAELGKTSFEVYLHNEGVWERAVTVGDIRLVVYGPTGRRLTDLEGYASGVNPRRPGLYDLIVLRKDEINMLRAIPYALPEQLAPGSYQVEALLIPRQRENWQDSGIEALLARDHVAFWEGPAVASKRYLIELE